MAIRQEIYTIYVRPNIKKNNVPVYFDKTLEAYMVNPFATPSAQCNHVKCEKEENGDGIWLSILEVSSLEQAQTKVKKLIKNIGIDYIKIEKKVPMDALITPIS